MAKKFKFNVKIYYEDTDSGGVVYYANYLKFLERARSETLYSLDFTNSGLLENYGILLIVKSCNIEYKKPAKFEPNDSKISLRHHLFRLCVVTRADFERFLIDFWLHFIVLFIYLLLVFSVSLDAVLGSSDR